jgi:hypothetical protein
MAISRCTEEKRISTDVVDPWEVLLALEVLELDLLDGLAVDLLEMVVETVCETAPMENSELEAKIVLTFEMSTNVIV